MSTKLRPGSAACLCRSCGEQFADEAAFDAHRPALPERGLSVARYLALVASGKYACRPPRDTLRLNRAGLWEGPSVARVSRDVPREIDEISVNP
ncbi:MAG TPA: hypothetical protein VF161_00875 [Steroidobacteraceae bacterium]